MKTIIKIGQRLMVLVLLIQTVTAHSQLEYLRPSPAQKIEQRVGMTDLIIEYSRPQMKGREIFGALVPYGKMWRTGANENTKITFDQKVRIGEQEIAAGTYALFTKPMETAWEFYFYTSSDNLDVPDPIDSSQLIFLTTVQPRTLNDVEQTLTINFYDITEDSATLGIRWEKTEVRMPIHFYTREVMEAKIADELERNALDFSIAAAYYYERDIELEKAKELQELSIQLRENPNPWSYNSYGLILYKLGEKEEALQAIRHSLELAKEQGFEYLTQENEKILRSWEGQD